MAYVRHLSPKATPSGGATIRRYPPRPDWSGGVKTTRLPGVTIRQPAGVRRSMLRQALHFGPRFMRPAMPPLVGHPAVAVAGLGIMVMSELLLRRFNAPGEEAHFSVPNGWIRCPNPNLACAAQYPPTHYRASSGSGNTCPFTGSCLTEQAFSGAQPLPVNAGTNLRIISFARHTHNVAGAPRYAISSAYRLPSSVPMTPEKPQFIPAQPPREVPLPNTFPAPEYGPMILPVQYPEVLPRPQADPWSRPRQLPRPRPYQRPSIDIGVRPTPSNPNPSPRPQPGLHNRLPPGRGEKEKKTVASQGVFGRLYGAATEVMDFLGCFEKNIRGNKCRNARGPIALAQCIYDNFELLDAGGTIGCLAQQQMTDKVIGKLSGGASKAYARNMGVYTPKSPFSIGNGQWTWRLN